MSTPTATHSNPGRERRWSVSAMKVLEECPRAWAFRYIDKHRPEAVTDPDYQRVGRALHAALEAAYVAVVAYKCAGRLIDHPQVTDDALVTLEQTWRDEQLDPAGRETAERMLMATLADRVVRKGAVLGVEHTFDLQTTQGTWVWAVADLIERVGDEAIMVTDWKSTAPRDSERIFDSPQLNLYGWCVRQKWPWATTVYAGEYYLGTQELVRVQLDAERMDFAACRIDAVAETAILAAADGYAPDPGDHCRFCRHCEICPAMGGGDIPAEQLNF